VDKVQYMAHVRNLPTPERRNAELAVFFRQPQEAEAIYLQAGMIFRAIQMNISLFIWERSEVT
jgi:intraflagellar transport protein 80